MRIKSIIETSMDIATELQETVGDVVTPPTGDIEGSMSPEDKRQRCEALIQVLKSLGVLIPGEDYVEPLPAGEAMDVPDQDAMADQEAVDALDLHSETMADLEVENIMQIEESEDGEDHVELDDDPIKLGCTMQDEVYVEENHVGMGDNPPVEVKGIMRRGGMGKQRNMWQAITRQWGQALATTTCPLYPTCPC